MLLTVPASEAQAVIELEYAFPLPPWFSSRRAKQLAGLYPGFNRENRLEPGICGTLARSARVRVSPPASVPRHWQGLAASAHSGPEAGSSVDAARRRASTPPACECPAARCPAVSGAARKHAARCPAGLAAAGRDTTVGRLTRPVGPPNTARGYLGPSVAHHGMVAHGQRREYRWAFLRRGSSCGGCKLDALSSGRGRACLSESGPGRRISIFRLFLQPELPRKFQLSITPPLCLFGIF